MLQTENPQDRFMNLHIEFVEQFKSINSDMKTLYAMPHKFIEENASAIDQFLANESIPGAPESFDRSVKGVKDFVYQLEDFKYQTMELFFEHRAYSDKCAAYLKKSQELRKSSMGIKSTAMLNGLTEELIALRFGLNRIREKGSEMMIQLSAIQGKWKTIKTN